MMRAGLYVHIPFCISKCRYCSFNSIPYNRDIAEAYMAALGSELAAFPGGVVPTSVYIGGGTPTALPSSRLMGLLDLIKDRFRPAEGAEVTLEANPGTLGGMDLAALRGRGVNRVSLGVQSFDPEELAMLGRAHGADEVCSSVEALMASGMEDVGLDLIYSLPGQDIVSWRGSLGRALALGVPHISIYDLSLEEGTRLYAEVKAGRLAMPPEPAQVEMYLAAVETLGGAGYIRYEISNFALPGHECLHNLNYWSGGDYAGFGAGACSTLDGVRSQNIKDVPAYIEAAGKGAPPVMSREVLSAVEREREFLMLGLRKREGVGLKDYAGRFGRDLAEGKGPALRRLLGAGYLEMKEGRISLTLKGVLASNSVTAELF